MKREVEISAMMTALFVFFFKHFLALALLQNHKVSAFSAKTFSCSEHFQEFRMTKMCISTFSVTEF